MILTQYENGKFPCQGITIIKITNNEASECILNFDVILPSFLLSNPSVSCYSVSIRDIIDIDCGGSLEPTPAPVIVCICITVLSSRYLILTDFFCV